jgi:phage shock protein PspC (stress-responsive transcriptional regulator)
MRLLFAIITFGGFGMGILIYILLWIILPIRDLDVYVGKRLFRNPDDKVIAGVAGGLAAYFNKPTWIVRVIFATPLILNILFGTLNGIFFAFHRDIFPNLFIGSFSGMFTLTYVILWMVLPEARSAFEKMEMRGEKVDVNRIRQNVKDEMENFKTRAQAWGDEVKTSAQQFGDRAKEFANTRGKAFAGEVAQTARPVASGIAHIIGVIFKAFFIFVAGCIALSLFAVLMVIIFGGVAWWPINDFLWTSGMQKTLAWGTLLFFIAVPVIGFMTWLVRRVVRVRSKSKNLGWIFGGLWLIGWICAVSFAASIAKDLRFYDKTEAIEVPITQNMNKMVVRVNEPEIHYSGNVWWIHAENTGWDIRENTMKYNNIKIRVEKSEDSLYHARLFKYSFGRSSTDAQQRAARTGFTTSMQDSILNIGSGLTINSENKFRGQGVILEIQVPVGKQIRFDGSLEDAFNPWVVRKSNREYGRGWGRRDYTLDWDHDEWLNWNTDVDYVMTSDGNLANPAEIIKKKNRVELKQSDADSLRKQIEEKEEQLRKDRDRLNDLEDKKNEGESTTQKQKKNSEKGTAFIFSPLSPLII